MWFENVFNDTCAVAITVTPASTTWATDVLRLGAEIRHDQLWFSQVGDNPDIQVIVTADQTA